jgi:predicted membrane protein
MADTPGAPRPEWEEKLERKRQYYRDKMERRRARWEARQARWEARGARQAHFYTGFGGAAVGMILAGIGVLLLLQNLGIVVVEDLWDYWPVILIVFGFSRLFQSCHPAGRIWGGAIAGVGTLFLLRNLGIIHGNLWGFFWPAILIVIGLAMLLRAFDHGGGWDWAHPAHALRDSSTANAVKIDAVFSGAKRRFDTQEFEGGEIDAVFGGVELDLTKAAMKGDQVRIECNAVFGGIDIRVPETWSVVLRGSGVFGGFSDETQPPPRGTNAPTLLIGGGAVFGGVNVKN